MARNDAPLRGSGLGCGHAPLPRRPLGMLLALAAAAAALLARCAEGHGYLYEPRSRQLALADEGKFNRGDAQSGNGPGVCGDNFQSITTNLVNMPTPSQATYAPGSTITLRVTLTANQ